MPMREVVLFSGTATDTATATGIQCPLPDEDFRSAIIELKVTAASGSSPTIDVKIQDCIHLVGTATAGQQPNGVLQWDDYAAFTQVTAAGSWKVRATDGGQVSHVEADGTLGAATVRAGPICGPWRVKGIVAGTGPSFTFAVVAKFKT